MKTYPFEKWFYRIILSALLGGLCLFGCPFYRLFHISCPGCGLTRAWLSFFHGDLKSALQQHSLFFLSPIFIFLFYGRDMVPHKKKILIEQVLYLLTFLFVSRYWLCK